MLLYKKLIRAYIILAMVAYNSALNLTCLKSKNSSTTKYCVVTNDETESTGIAIFDTDNRPLQGTSYSISTSFDCNISNDKNCLGKLGFNNKWIYDQSNNYNLSSILDRRWEALNVIETRKIVFTNIHNISGSTKYEITLNVKISDNANIFLCNGPDPSTSECYFIVLFGWVTDYNLKAPHSIIRKCEKNQLQRLESNFGKTNNSCEQRPEYARNESTCKHENKSMISNGINLTIAENEGGISVGGIQGCEMKYTDIKPIKIKHVFIASPNENIGHWKIDDKNYTTGVLPHVQLFGNKSISSFSFSLSLPNVESNDITIYVCGNQSLNYSSCEKIEFKKNSECKLGVSNWNYLTLYRDNITLSTANKCKTLHNKLNFKQKYVYFKSRMQAFWKIQSYGLLVGKNSGETKIDLVEGKRGQRVCVAIFVYVHSKTDLTLHLEDELNKCFVNRSLTKEQIWEEVRLSTVLERDTKVKLRIKQSNNIDQVYIGDIRDCSKNLRILKINVNSTNQVLSFNTWSNSSINPIKEEYILSVSSFNNSIIDILWLPEDGKCIKHNQSNIEKVANCSFNDTMFSKYIKLGEICHITLFKNSSNNICVIYKQSSVLPISHDHAVVWTLIPLIILLTCIATVIYLIKKDKIKIPKNISFISSRFCPTQGIDEDPLLMHLSVCDYSNFSCKVKAENFKVYFEAALRKGELLTQFNLVGNKPPESHSVGLQTENIRKNKYRNIIANDETRVILESQYNNVKDDYINANYIKGYGKEKAFIASQAPFGMTIHDFFRMIWQQNVECIVMLSKLTENGREKCLKYWPEPDEDYDCCGFTIMCSRTAIINKEITIRTLKVAFNNEEREVTQIHNEGWLDHSVPDSPQNLCDTLTLMANYENDRPIVVHCSAGIGRTGTLILCDICIKMAKSTKIIDVISVLNDLRRQRMNMVQTFDQYVYGHRVIASCLENL